MGNICCEEEQNTNRNRRQIVPTQYRNVAQYQRGRIQQEQHTETQKQLLRDFSITVVKLKKNAVERPNRMFRGVYTHSSISTDETSEYFAATLVEENDDFKACVVKKVLKQKLTTQYLKRSIAIEYLMTSHHHSNFIVRNLHVYENYTYLCLYFDIANYVHLNIFTHNPQYYAYFRANIQPNIRFVIAGVILALQELHGLQVVYRGINNQNIVIRENGYPLITNLASLHPQGHLPTAIQNSPFISPQQFRNQPITRAADFWALGVLIFHMITGNYPSFQNYREGEFNPFGISSQLSDLVNRLLRFDPLQRLGMLRINDLKAHAFFYGFDWQGYANQQLSSPFSRGRNDYPKGAQAEQQYDYVQKENFEYNSYSYGTGAMMGGLLFLELANLYMISSLYEREHLNEYPAVQNDEVPQAPLIIDQHQQGGAIQLSEGSNESPGYGGFD